MVGSCWAMSTLNVVHARDPAGKVLAAGFFDQPFS
jgi:hypothetical protein